jgi:hypothetical protein
MLHVKLFRSGLIVLSLLSLAAQAQTDCNYEDRRVEYLESRLETATGGELLVLQAYFGIPLDEAALASELYNIANSRVADFGISGTIMRVLFFTDGQYDDQIMSVLNTIPFWLPDTEGSERQYWSENHMIMWMSSDWLIHEKFGRDIRPTLRQMLVKWLDMKIEYGFYEYFSPIYYPFTFNAMLNLADFAEDEEIRTKAEQTATRLLTDVLLKVNDQGYYFPTCGRGDMGKFATGGVNGVTTIARFVTGMGNGSYGGRATNLATSAFDPSEICASWNSEVNTTLHYGHPLSSARDIYSDLSREDRIIFQWSAGAYFHPLTAQGTLWQISNFQLWEHEEFESAALAQFVPPAWGNIFAKVAASISRSSYIGHVEIDIFKKDGVVLTSSQDMWKGRAGYQIYPVVATVENCPVLLRSGEVYPDFQGVPERRSNDHLPYVDQDENVALVMWKPNWDLPIWGFGNKEVALKWETPAFDEERSFDNWQLGRIDDSYIAVRKHCGEIISGVPACPDADGQTWAIIVGNAALHGSFDEFEAMIGEAVYEERWYFNWQQLKWVYYGRIAADGKDIDHHWLGNLWDAPDMSNGRIDGENGRFGQFETEQVNIYPNPAKDHFTLDLRAYDDVLQNIYVFNNAGQTVYDKTIPGGTPPFELIQTGEWQQGVYTIVLENRDGSTRVKRLIVTR